jgi:CHAD domain-containing protein
MLTLNKRDATLATEQNREVEAKFQVSSGETLSSLCTIEQLSPQFAFASVQSKTHLDTYYDSASFHLLRAGYVLRVRESDNAQKVSIKNLLSENNDLLHDRLEVEQRILAGDKPPFQSQWSGDLHQIVARYLDPQCELVPIVTVRQNRLKRDVVPATPVSDAEQQVLAELSIDQAAILAPSPDIPADLGQGSATDHFSEVELETRVDELVFPLGEVAGQLAKRFQLKRVSTSKLERALLALHSRSAQAPYSPPGIQLDMPMAEAARLIWRTQLMQTLLCEHGVRADADIEYVHDLRVAIRRARTARRLFGRYFRRRAIKPYFDTWSQLARLAGAVRDLDIALVNLSDFQNRLPPTERDGLEEIRGEFLQHRRQARAEMVEWVNSDIYDKFVSGFSQFCASRGAGVRERYAHANETDPVLVRYAMPSVILDCFQHVRAYEALCGSPLEPSDAKHLHALRIACKHLRYVREFGRDLLGEPSELLIAQLKGIQDLLGELNDIAVEYQRLQHWQTKLIDNSVIRARLDDLDGQSTALLRSFPPVFSQFVGEENCHTLAKTLATF